MCAWLSSRGNRVSCGGYPESIGAVWVRPRTDTPGTGHQTLICQELRSIVKYFYCRVPVPLFYGPLWSVLDKSVPGEIAVDNCSTKGWSMMEESPYVSSLAHRYGNKLSSNGIQIGCTAKPASTVRFLFSFEAVRRLLAAHECTLNSSLGRGCLIETGDKIEDAARRKKKCTGERHMTSDVQYCNINTYTLCSVVQYGSTYECPGVKPRPSRPSWIMLSKCNQPLPPMILSSQ